MVPGEQRGAESVKGAVRKTREEKGWFMQDSHGFAAGLIPMLPQKLGLGASGFSYRNSV